MGVVLIHTSQQLVIQWIFFGLCVLAFTIRAYIRFVCFRRLIWEDFLMLLALACHLSVAVLDTLYLCHVYELIAAQQGGAVGPDFFSDALKGLKAFGTTSVLSLIGIWLIKLNFLLFFYRLGHHIRGYRIFWWVALIFNIGCGVAALGLLQYPCMFGDLNTVFVQCATVSNIRATYVHVIMTAVVDVISDISTFVIACIVSFRALFVNKPQQQSKQGPQPQDLKNEEKRWQQKRGRGFHDSILDTCRTLEGAWESDDALISAQSTMPYPPSESTCIIYSSDDSRYDYSMHNRV
ncbi:hypothetical protein Daus18300_013632 [Diaporthe australafricana]|uniref:Integral membrane protein n=1 Tax=Diaporthe australafricana TaxID=127596 RepID=A0ABR3VYG5_9PEZI